EAFVRAPHSPEGVWVSANAGPLRDDTGPLRGGVVVFNDISQRVRSTQRRTALYTVTTVLAESATLSEAVPRILQAVSRSVDWEVGALWLVDPHAQVLRCLDVWHADKAGLNEFVNLTRATTFAQGIGLPGVVWARREPDWITELLTDPNFPRAPVAARRGLRSAFAFPIQSGCQVTGVLEFFCRDRRERDDDLLSVIGSLGSQIGQFMERKRAEEELRKQRERFELCVRGSGDGV